MASKTTKMTFWCPNCQREVRIRKRDDGTFVNCPVCRIYYKKGEGIKKKGKNNE